MTPLARYRLPLLLTVPLLCLAEGKPSYDIYRTAETYYDRRPPR